MRDTGHVSTGPGNLENGIQKTHEKRSPREKGKSEPPRTQHRPPKSTSDTGLTPIDLVSVKALGELLSLNCQYNTSNGGSVHWGSHLQHIKPQLRSDGCYCPRLSILFHIKELQWASHSMSSKWGTLKQYLNIVPARIR